MLRLRGYYRPLMFAFLLVPCVALAAETLSIRLNAETEVQIQRYPASGEDLLLWLPSESGLLEQEFAVAQKLADSGVESWISDLHSAYFLPVLASSVEQIPPRDVAQMLEEIRSRTGKRIYLVGGGRGALLALRTAHAWQQDKQDSAKLAGAILLSPKLFVETPEPGKEGELMPTVSRTNLPIFILQPEKSPWRWKIETMLQGLEQSGSDVYVRILPGVRDRFYYRPNAVEVEDRMARELPAFLMQAMRLLQVYADKPRQVSTETIVMPPAVEGRKERILRPYQGDPQPPVLDLELLAGGRADLKKYRGRVVLVNFWASWCPPCVHEMPSMQALADRLRGRPFDILAVNMAEDRDTINQFLRDVVKVDFPILLDKDGAALRRWKVFAFPTTYVIDKRGRIRLALFGSIDWLQADVVEKIEALLRE